MATSHPRPWHRGSIFGDGSRRSLDREQRARFRYLIRAHRRAGRLTRAALDVGEALLRTLGVSGQCDPAHATIAEDAGCCSRTVRRAIVVMRALGLLRWVQRIVRCGWAVRQSSSQYELLATATAPGLLPASGGHLGREIQKS